MYELAFFLHLLAATVWTGGHLILATTILPQALKQRDIAFIQRFENSYERIGIPALLIQVVTGLYLANRFLPDHSLWFDFSHPIVRVISIKLLLLFATLALAIDARFRVIPKLSANNLVALAWHIIPVTILSVLFVVAGAAFKTGWLYT